MNGEGGDRAQGLGRQGGVQQGEAKAAIGFRDQQAGQAQFGKTAPDIAGVGSQRVGVCADALERARGARALPFRLSCRRPLVGGEGEIHDRLSFPATFGSRGMPRPR